VALTSLHVPGTSPSVNRWVGVALAVVLLALAGAAMLGSWQQAVIVRAVAAGDARVDTYYRVDSLAAQQVAVLHEALLAPTGHARETMAMVRARALGELRAVCASEPQAEHREEVTRLIGWHRRLGAVMERYLGQLDRGRTVSARALLTNRITPAAQALRSHVGQLAEEHAFEHAQTVAAAKRKSRLLQWGTALTFLVGLVILGALGCSARAHRVKVERMATRDALTGLLNRSGFQHRAELIFRRSKTEPAALPTVLMIDLDGFKDVNDSLGHHAGDLLLAMVASRLRGCLRSQDVLARVGGDEFAVLITDTDPAVGEGAAGRITQALNRPFILDGVTVDIEASVGIATAEDGRNLSTVLRQADTAMYAAKEHRLGFTRFDPQQTHVSANRLALLGDLRRALDTDQITLHFQPKVSLDTGELIGAEALARWHHPTRGLLGPDQFVGVLENSSLIHHFTTRVLQMALEQARAWRDAGHSIPVAVNVSTRNLLDKDFPDTIAHALASARVPGHSLCIEITENTLMARPERAIELLGRIRALGVRTAIDDFGTGYSSMGYLKVLPIDEIKVDRSFVRDMAADDSNRVLVESAIDLGHNLGLAVVAEGVEDDATLALLHRIGCDGAQGYYLSLPLAADDFASYLAHRGDLTGTPTPAPVSERQISRV
jgi:diguanylate cyclase (GGDEF)-like protein